VKASPFDIGWVAGILDGEGMVTISKRATSYVPVVRVSNTSKALIDRFCDIMDMMEISYCCYGKHKAGNRKYQWDVCIDGRPRVYKLLSLLKDHLVAKRQQANNVFEWIESRGMDLRGAYTDDQMALIQKTRDLNGRGRQFSENVSPFEGRIR
jgi:hypothetical protein